MTQPSINNHHATLSTKPISVNKLDFQIQKEIPQNPLPGFLHALIHEVRNPLTNINLSVELLRCMTTDSRLTPYFDIILRSANRVNTLVTGLLKNSELYEVPGEKYYIEQLLEEALQITEDGLRLKKIIVFKDYTKESYKCALNGPKIKIAFANIIHNAIDAMLPGQGSLRLITRVVKNKYVVMIQDNGCGISEQNLENIFHPFFTLKPRGLGIGLSATYEILSSDQVGINVTSKEGVGTSFILTFNKSQV